MLDREHFFTADIKSFATFFRSWKSFHDYADGLIMNYMPSVTTGEKRFWSQDGHFIFCGILYCRKVSSKSTKVKLQFLRMFIFLRLSVSNPFFEKATFLFKIEISEETDKVNLFFQWKVWINLYFPLKYNVQSLWMF